MKNQFKFRVLSVISIVFLCIGVTIKEFQNDTFYVIKLGEYINHHGVDLWDHYSWVAKLSYTYPHWLYDVFIYYIYHYFGYMGVYVSNIVLFIILILVVYYIHLKLHKNDFMASFVSILCVVCLFAFATARAQLPSAILFLLEVYFIEQLIQSGKNRYIVYLMIDSLLVANIHGTSWLFYFILFLPFFAEEVVCYISHLTFFRKKKLNDKILVCKIPHIKKLLVCFILCFMMGLFTPSRICYSYVFRVMMGDSQNYIMEHAPLIVIYNPCFISGILVLLIVLIFTNTKIYLREIFMIGGLILMSLMSCRHLLFFYLIASLYISVICVRALKIKKDRTLEILGNIIVRSKVVYFLILIIIGGFSCSKFLENQKKDYVPRKEYPVDAVLFIKENLDVDNLKLYNDYNFGSYLLFEDIPVFVDSRCDLYLKEFNGLSYSIFDDAIGMARKYEKKFRFYGVEYALLSKEDILYQLLDKDSNYQNIYHDKYFGIFKKL